MFLGEKAEVWETLLKKCFQFFQKYKVVYSVLRFEEIEQHWVTPKINDGFKLPKVASIL